MSTKKMSTYDKYISKLTPKQLEKFHKGYKAMIVSEIRLAIKDDDITIEGLEEVLRLLNKGKSYLVWDEDTI